MKNTLFGVFFGRNCYPNFSSKSDKCKSKMASRIKLMTYVVQFCALLTIQGGLLPLSLAQEQKASLLDRKSSKPQELEAKKEQLRKKVITEMQRNNGCTKVDSKKAAAAKKAQKKFNN